MTAAEPGRHRAPGAETGLRFRLYVEGEVVAEDWLHVGADRAATAAAAYRHASLARAAGAEGKEWLLEVLDPDYPDEPLCMGSMTLVETEVVIVSGVDPSLN
jgi:hypothetical protein